MQYQSMQRWKNNESWNTEKQTADFSETMQEKLNGVLNL